MKPATKSMAAAVLMLFAVLLGWRLSSPETHSPLAAVPQKPAPTAPQTSLSQLLLTPDDLPKISQPYARTPLLNLADPRWKEYEARRRLDPASEWKTPIEFFGKVIDENNQPVAGAVIDFAWSGTPGKYGGDGIGRRTLSSDSHGMFSLAGVEGKGMTVYVSKDGYHRRSESNGWFEYAGFWEPTFIEPDRDRPVIFHLVKRPVAEPTYRVRQRSFPKAPSWVKHIDLLAQPAETDGGGDMTLRIVRPPSPGHQNPFDWVFKLEGIGGAEFAESKEEFMLHAPDDGYQPALSKAFKQARGNSIETIKFYVRNKTRRLYAAVSVEITPYYPDHATKEDAACFIVTGTVNPNDSPNVEYDPGKDIREMTKK